MGKRYLSFVILAFALFAISCNQKRKSENVTEIKETADVGSFNRIRIQAPCSLTYEMGDTIKVVVDGDSDFVNNISLENNDGCLVVKKKRDITFQDERCDIYVVSPSLQSIDLLGAGSVDLKGDIKANAFSINMEGAGSVKSERIISQTLSVNIKGAGSVNLDDVTSEDIKMEMKGVGSLFANFTSSGALDCSLDGVGSVNLQGKVKTFRHKESGVGSINADKLKVGE